MHCSVIHGKETRAQKMVDRYEQGTAYSAEARCPGTHLERSLTREAEEGDVMQRFLVLYPINACRELNRI
jgi:hypothetical protein